MTTMLVPSEGLGESGRPVSETEMQTANVIDRLRDQPGAHASRPSAPRSEFRYAVGDQLKITFFEQLPVSGARGESGAPPLVERTELSGQYVVQLDGEVFLPIVGPIKLAQLTPAQAQNALVETAKRAVAGKLRVSVVVADREPVYVMGAGQKAGVFKHSPGMVVGQALALAGGAGREGGDLWKQIDIAREQERISKAAERMKRHLATIDVLVAEQSGIAPRASKRLIELAGPEAEAIVKAEAATRELERHQADLKRATLDKLIAALREEIASTRARMDQIAIVVSERSRRSEMLTARVRGGASTENLMVQAKRDLVEIQATYHELRSSIARSEYRLLELNRERDQNALAEQIEFERRLRTAQSSVAEDEVMVATIGQLLLKVGPVAKSGAPKEVSYVVTRRTSGGLQQIAADVLTPVEPGDLIRVIRDGEPPETASIR